MPIATRAGVEVTLRCNQSVVYTRQSQNAFADAAALLTNEIVASEIKGQFALRPVEQVQMRKGRGIRVKSVREHSVRVVIRPGGNETAWEYDVMGNRDQIDVDGLADALRRRNGQHEEETPVVKNSETIPPALVKSEPPLVKSEPVILVPHSTAGDSMSMLRRLGEIEAAVKRGVERRSKIEERTVVADGLRRQMAEVQAALAEVEECILRMQIDEEQDTEARSARELLAVMERFFAK